MPTKPVGATFTHATSLNYSSGPDIGTLTKVAAPAATTDGLVPGEVAASSHLNFPLNLCGEWTTWLDGGSSAASADAHIMETDAIGVHTILGMNVGGVASGTNPLQVQNTGTGGCGVFTRARDAVLPALELGDDGAGVPARGALYMRALPSNPTGPQGGDVWYSDVGDRGALMVYDDVTLTHQRVWGTTEGYYFKNGQSLGDFPTSSGSYVSVLALSIDGPPGVYTVAFNCKVESQVGATFSLGIQFSAGAIRSTEYSIPVSGSDGPFPVSATWTVTKGAPIMVCEIEAKSSNGLNVVHVLDSEITVQGLHDPTP